MATPSLASVPSASRSGKKLIVPRLSGFPPNCVKCGAPAERPWKRKFYWHASWLYILILFPGLLIYAIVALIVRKNIELALPLCDFHHSERKRYRMIGAILFLGGIPAGLLLESLLKVSSDVSIGVILVTMFAGLIFLAISGRTIRATLIDESHAEFAGAGKAFLDLLPEQSNA